MMSRIRLIVLLVLGNFLGFVGVIILAALGGFDSRGTIPAELSKSF